ncbi:Glycosyltransferase involved in cell wall bisynthesis [Parapedobacter luteus]|uniref:Glycosyltransferase involved in cell wall bisynthesis n=1 Tax=Parapedobacter luteus TaxID=623280 RepID=A0A1T5DFT9_9SPHI|nr:glycosyltransferase family 2 protein [Parapedobacter luteus]SKB70559.1 Glycosyltransferase involved in cell wall bisynthesis [Parapedobacter luteus]
MPKLSVITINFNNLFGLKKTIESVINQTFREFEYVIIDGGSTDGSRELIEANRDKITYWVSEPDGGIYNAMNKGTQKATGDFIIYMNSGDYFYDDNVLSNIIPFLNAENDIVYGDLVIVEPNRSWVKKYNEKLNFPYFIRDTLPHQGSFIRTSLLHKQQGPYDERLSICADWKFFIDAVCKLQVKTHYVDYPISYYDYSGLSSKIENREKLLHEKRQLLKEEYAAYYEPFLNMAEENKEMRRLLKSRIVKAYLKIRGLIE